MFGSAGRSRRVGRRTGAHGRRIIGRGRGRNRDGRTMVGEFGRNRDDLTMVRGLGRSRVGRIMVAGPDRNLGDRTTVEDPGRNRVDLTMARALGRNLVGRIMVEGFDRRPADRIMAGGPDRNLGDPTTVGVLGLSRADRTMVRGRALNLIGRMVGNGRSLRGLTMARDLSRPGPAVGVDRARRRLVSRARLPLIGAPSPPTGATNARSRSDRCGSFRHRASV
jgi:hypothetical protein